MTTGTKNAIQHLFILKTFGQLWRCNQKLQDSVGNKIYRAFASDRLFSQFHAVSFRVYARSPAFMPPKKPTVLESHVGRSAICSSISRDTVKTTPLFVTFHSQKQKEITTAPCQVSNEADWPQLGTIFHVLQLHKKFPWITATFLQLYTSWH
jgi:hypothetical protein